MNPEQITYIFIIAHASLGGIALATGFLALLSQKGSKWHKIFGKLFFYSMLLSASISLVISSLPNHKSSFLFSIGLFSIYFLVSGYRSLALKNKQPNLLFDKILAFGIICTGITMISYPILIYKKLNIILLIFGIVSVIFGIRDIISFKNLEKLRENWLKLHLGKITGAYIASVSAFFVVNQILPGIWNWFAPSIVGSLYITYWIRKIDKKTKPHSP